VLVFDNEGDYTPESMERLLAGQDWGGARDRPYDGQPWTAHGERGRQIVAGLTVRDIGDCIARGTVLLSGLDGETQNIDNRVIEAALLEIEKMMGIYPNVPDGPVRIPMLTIGAVPDPPKGAS
jgi:hypothetical protein